jgi:hypothetical protein
MPEAAVHEYGHARARKHEVDLTTRAGQQALVESIAKSERM